MERARPLRSSGGKKPRPRDGSARHKASSAATAAAPSEDVVILPAARRPTAAAPPPAAAAGGGDSVVIHAAGSVAAASAASSAGALDAGRAPPAASPPITGGTRALHGAVIDKHVRGAGKTLYVRVSEWLVLATFAAVVAISITMLVFLFTNEAGAGLHTVAFSVGGIFVALTLPLSMHDLHMHCAHYVSPLQKYYLRILMMVPIYSVESWLALRFPKDKFIFATMRETYEAYTLYMFYMLMLCFLGGPRKLAERLAAKERERAPACAPCLKGWRLGNRFVHRCTVAVYQYVALRVLCSILMLVLEPLHLYNEGNFNPRYFYPWSSAIINLSQCYALYGLALFYVETREWLKPLKPLGKFGVIKALVFLTWWQGLLIMVLDSWHLIKGADGFSALDVSKGLQDFAIVVEMFFAAIAHRYFFSATDFWTPSTGTITPLVKMQKSEVEFTRTAQSRHSQAPLTGGGRSDGPVAAPVTGVMSFAGASSRASGSAPASGAAPAAATGAAGDDEPVTVQIGGARGGSAGGSRQGGQALEVVRLGGGVSRARAASASGSAPPGTPGQHHRPVTPVPAGGGVASDGAALDGGADVATPAPFMTVVREMLPFDSVGETAELLRSGFGVLHKREKRKREAAESAAQLDAWEQQGSTRTRGKSKFGGSAAATPAAGAGAGSLAPPPSPLPFDLEGGEECNNGVTRAAPR